MFQMLLRIFLTKFDPFETLYLIYSCSKIQSFLRTKDYGYILIKLNLVNYG